MSGGSEEARAPGLRERQRALGRELIFEACAELVNERRHLDFSMQEVATKAGVSLRTVYNHFPTREDLLDALVAHLGGRMTQEGGVGIDDIGTLEEVAEAVRVNFAIFGALGGLSEAVAQMSVDDAHRDATRTARTHRFVELAQGAVPDGDPGTAHALGLLVRHLASHGSWFALTRDYGLSSDEAARLVSWAVARLVDAAQAGGLDMDETQ